MSWCSRCVTIWTLWGAGCAGREGYAKLETARKPSSSLSSATYVFGRFLSFWEKTWLCHQADLERSSCLCHLRNRIIDILHQAQVGFTLRQPQICQVGLEYEGEATLGLLVPLPPPLKCLGFRCVPPYITLTTTTTNLLAPNQDLFFNLLGLWFGSSVFVWDQVSCTPV